MIKKPNLEDLKVGDTVYVLKYVRAVFVSFRYRIISKEKITRITPKRTKIITNKDEYVNCNPFVIPDEELITQHNIAKAFDIVNHTRYYFDKQDLLKYSDEEILKLSELAKQLQVIIDAHNYKECNRK